MTYKHMDEAWRGATEKLREWLRDHNEVERAVLAGDLYGKIRIILWGKEKDIDALMPEAKEVLEKAGGCWWSGNVWIAKKRKENPVHALAWEEGEPDIELSERLRLLERHRNRGAWFADLGEPVWLARGTDDAKDPPIVVFYSFKGGLGRSTALASFAMQRARRGERVAVVDFDLDAPGVGVLLAGDDGATGDSSPWGTVDYLLEQGSPAPLADYYQPCRRQEVVGNGELFVFSAGLLDGTYPGKLARVDLEPARDSDGPGAIEILLHAIRQDLRPDWILLDARTGLSEPAGALLSGLAHLHVLFGTPSEQSWQGLRVVIDRLGARRVARGMAQGDCILVQAMVPADTESAKRAREAFATRARDEFTESFYAATQDGDSANEPFWDLSDLESADAPHVPVPLSYELKLAHFRDIVDVATLLAEGAEYRELADRIAARFQEAMDE